MDFKNQQKNQKIRTIGFDCHPETFTAAALTGKEPLSAKVEWIDHKVSLEKLESWLKRRITPTDVLVIEASENTFSVVKRIQEAGRTAVILESCRASKVKKSYCSTDKTSAVSLAKVYLSGFSSVVWMPDEKTLNRREIFHAHRKAVTDSTRTMNRIYSFLNQHELRSFSKKNKLKEETYYELLTMKEWTNRQKQLISFMFNDLWHAHEKRKKLRSIMAEDILNDPQALKLVRIYGIRHITAYALSAFIGDINRFSNPKKLVAYIGLNPRINSSGLKDKSSGRSRVGRRDLRSLLVESAHTVFKNSTHPLYKWAWKLHYRKGANVAVIAVARKLVISCWYLLRGFFTSLEDIPETIKIKIDKLVSEIGTKRVKSWGYRLVKDYKQEKYEFLLNSC